MARIYKVFKEIGRMGEYSIQLIVSTKWILGGIFIFMDSLSKIDHYKFWDGA